METEVTKKQAIIKTFEDLDVWKVCRNLRTQIATTFEIIDHLTVAQEEKLISDEAFTLLREHAMRAISVVNGFIRYLSKAKSMDHV